MNRITWSKNSARPFESLFILVMRLLWLNLPAPRQFAELLGIKPYQLSVLDLTFGRTSGRKVDLSKLKEMLPKDNETWSRAILGEVHVGDDVCPSARFCKHCLQFGYHTAAFQLMSVTTCPIHSSRLIIGCPLCGALIPTVLSSVHFASPLVCTKCRQMFLDEKCLVNPPAVEMNHGIESIFDWYEKIYDFPKVLSKGWLEWRRGRSAMRLVIFPLLERVTGMSAPSFLHLNRDDYSQMMVRQISCGILTKPSERMIQNSGWRWTQGHNEEHDIALYRWYRRRLRKSVWRSRQTIALFLKIKSDPWNKSLRKELSYLSNEDKVETFALMLFLFTMEGHAGLHAMKVNSTRLANSFDNLFNLKDSECHAPLVKGQFECSDAEKCWIRAHFVLDGLRGLFEEAIGRAKEMVESGRYYLVDLSRIEGFACPFSLAWVNSNQQLEYWSMVVRPDRHRFRSDQADFMQPNSFRLFLKELDILNCDEPENSCCIRLPSTGQA